MHILLQIHYAKYYVYVWQRNALRNILGFLKICFRKLELLNYV